MTQLTRTQLRSFKLKVSQRAAEGHTFIREESYTDKAGLDFNDRYVYFSGFFGALGPEIFTQVPEMLVLLQDLAFEDSLPKKYRRRINRILKGRQRARRTKPGEINTQKGERNGRAK